MCCIRRKTHRPAGTRDRVVVSTPTAEEATLVATNQALSPPVPHPEQPDVPPPYTATTAFSPAAQVMARIK